MLPTLTAELLPSAMRLAANHSAALTGAPLATSARAMSIFPHLWSSSRRSLKAHAVAPNAGEHAQSAAGHGGGTMQPAQPMQPPAQASSESGSLARRTPDLMAMPAPFRRLSDYMMEMQREMDSVFNSYGMPTDPFDMLERVERSLAPALPALDRSALRSLALDVAEDDKQYTVSAEVPGFDKDEIKVLLSPEGVLTVQGEKREEQKAKEGQAGFARRYSAFKRSVLLPSDVKGDEIKASVKNGVLSLAIPKLPAPQAPKHKEIPITTA